MLRRQLYSSMAVQRQEHYLLRSVRGLPPCGNIVSWKPMQVVECAFLKCIRGKTCTISLPSIQRISGQVVRRFRITSFYPM